MLNNIIIYKFMLIFSLNYGWRLKHVQNIIEYFENKSFFFNIKLFFIKIYVATLNLSKVE